jgi:large subunit ribosomal protein L10
MVEKVLSRKELKKQIVQEITEKLRSAPVVAVIDLHTLPAVLLHTLRKRVRGDGTVIVKKTTLLRRALKAAGKDKIIEYMKGEKALLIANENPFALFKKIRSEPLKIYAKPGQTAPDDIIVPAGETMLAPGPVLTELKQAGIDARIQAGKIAIAKDSTVVKKGETIKEVVAKALQKLDIKPFELNVNIPAILEGDIVYTPEVLHIDEKEFVSKIISAFMGAKAITLDIGYVTRDNIGELLAKAYKQARYIGIERNIVVPELMEDLVKKAARQATVVSSIMQT